ncbi:ZIP Zinc transporter family protein [Trichosporon asahii var. asahii CBS 8904]|uniref:ZIP Zinc transporter family protein n=1 Tax=Trichosporon asahii var. asahii (strain CBS 8904) TaxID=1220162 RepID=K1VQL9_TRIAC|nr:ZIP Zinc transporter family protein [Trichosporon asahii var. asahii CBS 8904]
MRSKVLDIQSAAQEIYLMPVQFNSVHHEAPMRLAETSMPGKTSMSSNGRLACLRIKPTTLRSDSPCLGTLHFPPTAPAIALAGAFITFLFDFVAAWRQGVQDDRDKEANEACNISIETAQRRKAAWQVILLEAGIIFHSVMIGVTLGADSSSAWTTLLLVIIFHQLFEGAALEADLRLMAEYLRLV